MPRGFWNELADIGVAVCKSESGQGVEALEGASVSCVDLLGEKTFTRLALRPPGSPTPASRGPTSRPCGRPTSAALGGERIAVAPTSPYPDAGKSCLLPASIGLGSLTPSGRRCSSLGPALRKRPFFDQRAGIRLDRPGSQAIGLRARPGLRSLDAARHPPRTTGRQVGAPLDLRP
jgi:hypothetical protein